MKNITVEELKSENKQMKDLLTKFSNWSDEMCNWLDAGVRARGASTILLKKLSEELLPLKPLSELHKDEEACRMVFKVSTGALDLRDTEKDYQYFVNSLINDRGALEGLFLMVNTIRSLGYDVQPETKTP